MENSFKKLIKILDKELEAYTQLRDLFQEKKELLKKAKSDDLGVIDNKILAQNETIVKLNDMRKNLSMELLMTIFRLVSS